MDALSSWPIRLRLPNIAGPEIIVLDMREQVEQFLSKCMFIEDAKEDFEIVEKHLQNIIADIVDRENAEFELAFSAHQISKPYEDLSEGAAIFCQRALDMSVAYHMLAVAVLNRLVQLRAYHGRRLQYHYVRRLGNDLVLARNRI